MLLSDIPLTSEKHLNIILNGSSSISFEFSYPPPLTLQTLRSNIESKWGIKIRRLRVFNQEGVQFYPQDLRYLKNKSRIYVSLKGEDFDANSSYGEYEVMKQLGEGGFGKVFFAQHRQTLQNVAIKVMKAEVFNEAGKIDSVFAEAENLKALNHSNIVQIINCYALKDMQVVVIMQYMEGGELLQYLLEKGRFTDHQARIFFKQMINAVGYCHSKNVIHRDLKLENILLKQKGSTNIKIADFGISGGSKKFNPNANVGTLKYMAPQILLGIQKGTTTCVDIWSLGIILYFMVTGKLPFNAFTSSQTIKLITTSQVCFPEDIDLSFDLKDLILKLLTKQPKNRIKINELRDHPWINNLPQLPFSCLKTQNYLSKAIVNNKRESIDQITQRRSQKQRMFKRASISIPKRLQKQKGDVVRQLLKYGKVKSNNYKTDGPSKNLLKRMTLINDPRFRKCLIQ